MSLARPLRLAAVGVITLLLLVYCALLLRHWGAGDEPAERLVEARQRAERWILDPRDGVLRQNNPALWWMVARSAALTGNEELTQLVTEYLSVLVASAPDSPWRAAFVAEYRPVVTSESFASLPDYQQLMEFALLCDPRLLQLPPVGGQLEADYCWTRQLLSPTCTTHQVIGLALARDRACPIEGLPELLGTLTDRVNRQLRWDPRRVDLFLQRAMVLVDERGAAALPAGVLGGVLDSQLPDGSWSAFEPLLPLGGGRYLGFGDHGLRVQATSGSFHSTAQALLLLALIEQEILRPGFRVP